MPGPCDYDPKFTSNIANFLNYSKTNIHYKLKDNDYYGFGSTEKRFFDQNMKNNKGQQHPGPGQYKIESNIDKLVFQLFCYINCLFLLILKMEFFRHNLDFIMSMFTGI